jgi:hypothetical protein
MPAPLRKVHPNRAFNIASLLLILIALLGIQLLIRDSFSDARELRDGAQRSVSTRASLGDLLAIHLNAETVTCSPEM